MKLWDPGGWGSGECQCQGVRGEGKQQKAAVLTPMGGSLLKEEGSFTTYDLLMRLLPSSGCNSCNHSCQCLEAASGAEG